MLFRSERLLVDDNDKNGWARGCFRQVLQYATETRWDRGYYNYHHDIHQTVSEGDAGHPNDTGMDLLRGRMVHLRKTFRWENRQRLDERLDDVRVPISQWRWLVREFPWVLRLLVVHGK